MIIAARVTLLPFLALVILGNIQDAQDLAYQKAKLRESRRILNKSYVKGLQGVLLNLEDVDPSVKHEVSDITTQQFTDAHINYKMLNSGTGRRQLVTPILNVIVVRIVSEDSKPDRYSVSISMNEGAKVSRNGMTIGVTTWSSGSDSDGNDRLVGGITVIERVRTLLDEFTSDVLSANSAMHKKN